MQFPESISATLDAGGVVVASSSRAARALRKRYGEAQVERGLTAWRAAEILDWDGWLEKLWFEDQRSGAESRLLLSRAQEHRVWIRLVKPDIEGRRLISSEGIAELAQQAYARLCDYLAFGFLRSDIFGGTDIDRFRDWARGFERQCREHGWLSRSMLPISLSGTVGRAVLPRQIVLLGFDRITPAQQNLMDACATAECSIRPPEEAHPLAPVEMLVSAADPREEISLCALWARNALDEAAARGAKVRIAVLVPDAGERRSEIERIFRQTLAPASVAVASTELPLPFEFALGTPLARIPMARAALLLLRWLTAGLEQEELTWLALSGFLWGKQTDLLPSAKLDAELREKGVLLPEQGLDTYLRRQRGSADAARNDWYERLRTAQRLWRAGGKAPASFAHWVDLVQAVLSAAGWPGAHEWTSEDFQAKRKWEQLLDRIAALNFDGRLVDSGEFLRTLKRQAEETIFSPESHDAPVQILGPFEAAGIEFDAVWFLGADEIHWPAQARPHPFLTRSLQKQHGMPHADNNGDWELAKLVTERIQRSTARCIFSYARQGGDGERHPTTVLAPQPPIVSGEELRARLAAGNGLARQFESEWEFPPLTVHEEPASGIVWPAHLSPGGQEVLKRQAACPFQAFAVHRLGTRPLEGEDWGFDPKERGQLLHTSLEGIWKELKDRETLIQAAENGRLAEIVLRHVTSALGRREGADRWTRAYLQAEEERLVRLIGEWLNHERQRPPFAVEHLEEKLSASVGNLVLKLRADRIDTVTDANSEDGRLLIDYKSGRVHRSGWEGERPDEPQLPLYAVYGNVPALRGVLWAQIRPDNLKYIGSVADPSVLTENSVSPDFTPDLRHRWEEVLMALGEQFSNGEAQVDPKRYPKTCEYCGLSGLCRVVETRRVETDSESQDGGDDEE